MTLDSDASKRFRRHINGSPDALPLLPCVHTAMGKSLNEILLNRELRVARCNVFTRENLLYFFYGKPAYRPGNDGKTSLEMWRALITFVVSTTAIKHIARIFPFDSGAFARGKYEAFIGNDFELKEFGLPTSLEVPPRVVGAFFGSNANYWDGIIRSDCMENVDQLDFHSQVYASMNSAASSTDFDMRAGVIEIQALDTLPLTKDTLEAIIVPDLLITHHDVQSLATECEATIIGYRWRKDRPAERAHQVDSAVLEWLQTSGRI